MSLVPCYFYLCLIFFSLYWWIYLHSIFCILLFFSWVINIASFKNSENISCLIVTCALNSPLWSTYPGHKLDSVFVWDIGLQMCLQVWILSRLLNSQWLPLFVHPLIHLFFTIQSLCRYIQLGFKYTQNYPTPQGFFISFLLIIIINIIITINLIIFVIIRFTLFDHLRHFHYHMKPQVIYSSGVSKWSSYQCTLLGIRNHCRYWRELVI